MGKKVILFTASYGDGHRQVSRALEQAFSGLGIEVIELDSFRDTNRVTAEASERSYELSTQYFPWLYGASYRLTADLPPRNPLWQAFALLSRKAALAAIEEHQPDAVLQLFPDHSLSSITKFPGKRPFIGVVLTDYSVHSRWFHGAVDSYFLADDSLLPAAHRLAGSRAALRVSGIPVRSEFVSTLQPTPCEQPYILFSTGGRGVFRDMSSTLRLARKVLPELRIFVMCGRNESMFAAVDKLGIELGNIVPLGFQTNMAAWLQNASLAIMKSGGVSITEALVSECPMILYRPLEGQEADNARFVQRIGGGRIVRGSRQLEEALMYYREETNRRTAKEACRRVSRPDAAMSIAKDILSQIK